MPGNCIFYLRKVGYNISIYVYAHEQSNEQDRNATMNK